MSLSLKPGSRVYSAVSSVEMIAVRAPTEPVEITIGGAPVSLEPVEGARDAGAAELDRSAHVGKRYVDQAGTIELLCTKPGEGLPALNGEVLMVKEAKPLPSSD